MDTKALQEEIRVLESKIEEMKASKPSHDFTGAYGMRFLELEEELDAKKKALRNASPER